MNVSNASFSYESSSITNRPGSRKTLVIDREDDNPMFSLLNHFISLAMYDDAFEAKSAKDFQNMF